MYHTSVRADMTWFLLQKIKHPFLIQLLWSHIDSGRIYFLFPYIAGGELFYHLRKVTNIFPIKYPGPNIPPAQEAGQLPGVERAVLRGGDRVGAGLPPRPRHRLPRPQAREHPPRQPRPHRHHRLRVLQGKH